MKKEALASTSLGLSDLGFKVFLTQWGIDCQDACRWNPAAPAVVAWVSESATGQEPKQCPELHQSKASLNTDQLS